MEAFMAPGCIERSCARSEIEALFHRCAVLATETPDLDKMSTVFEEDGIFRLPDGVTVKPRNLLQVVRGNSPKFICHHVTSMTPNLFQPARRALKHTFRSHAPIRQRPLGSMDGHRQKE